MIQKRELSEREKWFRERSGCRVFRNDNGCKCDPCQDTLKNGLIIHDEHHADYLYDTECDYAGEGYPVRYFDTQEEAQTFENQLNQKPGE